MSADPSTRSLEAAQWCHRLADIALSEEEFGHFQHWLAADPENRRSFDLAAFTWRALDGGRAPQELVEIRIDALQSLHRQEGEQEPQPDRRIRIFAAMAAMLLMVVTASLWLMRPTTEMIETGIGERRIVMLEDGSRVSLDAASKIEVAYEAERRVLRLIAGRAKFDVAKDYLRPFSVLTRDKLVIATGTSFSVERLASSVDITLFEGQVALMRQPEKGTLQPVNIGGRGSSDNRMVPGTRAILPDRPAPPIVTTIGQGEANSWESGLLFFDNETLGAAVERFNRYAARHIVIADPAIASLQVNGIFEASNSDAFVEGVTGVLPVARSDTRERIVLTAR